MHASMLVLFAKTNGDGMKLFSKQHDDYTHQKDSAEASPVGMKMLQRGRYAAKIYRASSSFSNTTFRV